MDLYSSPDLDPGEFKVAMNPGVTGGEPFGVIKLGPGTSLHIDSDEDADRLIRAAVRTKEYRARVGVPHEWKSRNGLCEFCGMSRAAHPAPEPALEGTVTAPPQDAPYAEAICGVALDRSQSVTCGLPPGHDGDYHVRETGEVRYRWPRQASEFADETATAGAR